MNQVTPYALWLGNAGTVADVSKIFDAGIKALVQLAAEELPVQSPRELISCHFPLLDGAGNRADLLFLAVNTVATLVKLRIPTLVFAGAGMSRAPAVAAAALAMVRREAPEDCLTQVMQRQPGDLSPGLWSEVTALLPSVR